MASSYPQFGLNYPLPNNPQMMTGPNLNCMQPGQHTPNCDSAHARPIASDPQTGQSICICQYHNVVNTAYRQYLHFSPTGPPSNGSFSSPSANGLDHSGPGGPILGTPGGGAFSPTSMSSGGLGLSGHPDPLQAMYGPHGPIRDGGVFSDFKDMTPEAAAAWRTIGMGMGMGPQNPSMTAPGCYGPYDPSLGPAGVYSSSPYCTNGYAMDPTGMNRRKNATRETTSQLKHWLYEHRKNPYPTKGEKIMLAIVTKMSLTQVSTWFANARRRLKKENKMTWSPRNRGCEDDDKSDTDEQMTGHDQDLDLDKNDDDSLSELSSLTDENKRNISVSPPLRDFKDPSQLQSLSSLTPTNPHDSVNKPPSSGHPAVAAAAKPRIWSLADVAMDRTPAVSAATVSDSGQPPRSQPVSLPPNYAMFPMNPHMSAPGLPMRPMAPPGSLAFFPQFSPPGVPPPAVPHPSGPMGLFTSNPNSAFSTPIHPNSLGRFGPPMLAGIRPSSMGQGKVTGMGDAVGQMLGSGTMVSVKKERDMGESMVMSASGVNERPGGGGGDWTPAGPGTQGWTAGIDGNPTEKSGAVANGVPRDGISRKRSHASSNSPVNHAKKGPAQSPSSNDLEGRCKSSFDSSACKKSTISPPVTAPGSV